MGVRALRNVAIIAALAAVVAFAPAGGSALETLMVALTMVFLAAIAWAVARFAERNELTLASLGDRERLLLFGAGGVLALLLTGSDRFFGSGLGTVAWLALLIGSIMVAWRVWQEANSY